MKTQPTIENQITQFNRKHSSGLYVKNPSCNGRVLLDGYPIRIGEPVLHTAFKQSMENLNNVVDNIVKESGLSDEDKFLLENAHLSNFNIPC